MFKEITIRNFKAISDLTIKLTPFTVLIGENSCGKSTILQALDFLCSLASRDIDEYLRDREWTFEDIRSQFCRENDSVSFSAKIDIDGTTVVWSISIKCSEKWEITESVVNVKTEESYLPVSKERVDVKSSAIKILSSMWAYGNTAITREQAKFINKMKFFLESVESYELLSPYSMKHSSSRGLVSNIGISGDKLATYIHSLNESIKEDLSKNVSDFVGFPAKIITDMKGKPGWVEMYLEESFSTIMPTKIKKFYISDGLLRIIALCTLLINQQVQEGHQISLFGEEEPQQPKGFVLLDEIEDGINPDLAEKLMVGFQKAADEKKRQFIITSHSPVMVNYVNPENIVFMWRDEQGKIHAKPLFETEQMKDTLEFLNPGEAWLNYSKDDIIKRLSGQEGDND